MSSQIRPTGLGADAIQLGQKTPTTDAKRLAMRAIEVRFAAALAESALPKSAASFGKGTSGSIAREHLVNRIAQVLSDSNALGIAKAAELREGGPAAHATGERQQGTRPA